METKTVTTRGPLINQLGTGAIPSDEEGELLARGIQFAAYFDSPNGPRCLVISRYPNIYQRLGEQLEQLYDEEVGLPVHFRIPAHQVSD